MTKKWPIHALRRLGWRWRAALAALAALVVTAGVVTVADAAPARWTKVETGRNTTCAIKDDRSLWCWGVDDGTLPLPPGPGYSVPQRVGTDSDWQTVNLGRSTGCGLRDGGKLYCWGSNNHGALGLGDTDDTRYEETPVRVGTRTYDQLSLGDGYGCAIATNRKLYCWGHGASGGLGLGDTADRDAPAQVGFDYAKLAEGGAGHMCGIKLEGTLYCWGSNFAGQVDGNLEDDGLPEETPKLVDRDKRWEGVATGERHTCARTTDRKLYCWGDNLAGELGLGHQDPAPGLNKVVASDWRAITAGNHVTCGLEADSDHVYRYCWGINHSTAPGCCGQNSPRLGLGTDTEIFNSPKRLTSDLDTWSRLSEDEFHGCGLTAAGELYCWGYNDAGQVGDGTTEDARTPHKVDA